MQMFSFLKRLYELRGQKVTFVIWDEQNPDSPESYQLVPRRVFFLNVFVVCIIVISVNLVLMYTPAGNYLAAPHESIFRNELLGITTRIIELQDSLTVRDRQLAQMREILRESPDTTFTVGANLSNTRELTIGGSSVYPLIPVSDFQHLNFISTDLDFSGSDQPIFPTFYPVSGTLSRSFKPESGHFGIDIASQSGTEVRAVAWGIVSSVEWSLNFGYIIHVQHRTGFLSIYKHLSGPVVSKGDVVQKGDILGAVSNSGILSSGPHLHYELWQDGEALDPALYLLTP
jgi:murein DD-endopeptidase MepM/ murein hydrolase activator NlpD